MEEGDPRNIHWPACWKCTRARARELLKSCVRTLKVICACRGLAVRAEGGPQCSMPMVAWPQEQRGCRRERATFSCTPGRAVVASAA